MIFPSISTSFPVYVPLNASSSYSGKQVYFLPFNNSSLPKMLGASPIAATSPPFLANSIVFGPKIPPS